VARPSSPAALARIAALGCLSLCACRLPDWDVTNRLRASDAEVASALGDTTQRKHDEDIAAEIPVIPYPRALRPCCAFGADLTVEIGLVPVPGVEIGNLLEPDGIGNHRYDNGALSFERKDPRGFVDQEHNGLVYTCRGGFIDLAHVRDNADNTLALAAAIARGLRTGVALEVPPQGAALRVRVRPLSSEAIEKYGTLPLATAAAQWVAYQLSIWHEIATFYGYAALASWPEKLSSFSPEDLYSNQLGARIAGGIIHAKGARSSLEYDLSMDAWLERALERLDAVPLADSQQAMRALDGAWWDSHKRIPDWTLVMRRHFDVGPYLAPWVLEEASPGANGPVEPLASCRDSAPPLVLYVHDGFAGALFRDYATLEIEVGESLVAAGFPLPRAPSRALTQADFPAVIDAIHAASVAQFGPGAGAP